MQLELDINNKSLPETVRKLLICQQRLQQLAKRLPIQALQVECMLICRLVRMQDGTVDGKQRGNLHTAITVAQMLR